MKKLFALRSYRKQRAVFLLLTILVVIQIYFSFQRENNIEDTRFTFDSILQQKIDSLKRLNSKQKIFPFNPNYISLSKGYQLELSLEELERLHKFRLEGKFVNSVSDFIEVTQVSSMWVDTYSPYFKFPKWVESSKGNNKNVAVKGQKKAINSATENDLMRIRGIGKVLSKRIIEYRSHLKGFETLDQLYEIPGLNSAVVQRLYSIYEVKKSPN